MKTRLLLISSAVVALTSCSTYKAGQTPDDVYYSPARKAVYAETQQDRTQGQDEYVDMSDRYLRMKSMNRSRWSSFDEDYMYWNNPTWNNAYAFNSFYTPYSTFSPYYGMGYGYGSGLSIGFGSMYGGYYGGMGYGYSNFWGSPFHPGYYGSPIVIVGKPVYVNPAAHGPRTYNLNTYANPNRPVSAYSHIPVTGGSYRGSDRNGNATYSAPVRVFSSTPSVNTGGSSYRGGTYRGTDGSGYQNATPRSNTNYGNNGSSGGGRSFNSGGSRGGSSGGSSGGSAPTRSFRSGKG